MQTAESLRWEGRYLLQEGLPALGAFAVQPAAALPQAVVSCLFA